MFALLIKLRVLFILFLMALASLLLDLLNLMLSSTETRRPCNKEDTENTKQRRHSVIMENEDSETPLRIFLSVCWSEREVRVLPRYYASS